MYFLVSLFCLIVASVLFICFRQKKQLHLDILMIIFASTTLMWLVDSIFSVGQGEAFISFEIPLDIWISVWTIVGGLVLWMLIKFILNRKENKEESQK